MKSAHSVNWGERAPASVSQTPAQLTDDCRSAYYLAGREFFAGRGAMVDCGTLAGGSSVALLTGAQAILQQTHRPDLLYAFDMFRCDHANPEFFSQNFGGQWSTGQSFRHIYDLAIEKFSEYVRVVDGDILEFQSWEGPLIEVLGVDVWKSAEIAEHCVRVFFPNLALGSLVLQQDYNHVWLPHIHRIMEAFCGFFERIREPAFSGTAIFQLVRKIDVRDVEAAIERYRDRIEGKLLAEAAARRAAREPTRFFVQIADCLREAEYSGRTAGLLAVDNIVQSNNNWVGADEATRVFFLQQASEIRGYINQVFS